MSYQIMERRTIRSLYEVIAAIILMIITPIVLNGCEQNDNQGTQGINSDNMFTARDFRTTYENNVVHISLEDNAISCDSSDVVIDGTTATLSKDATYVVSGTLADGSLIVDGTKDTKLQIAFDNASITSATSAPLYVRNANKVFVTLVDGTSNTLTNGGTFTAVDDNSIDGAIFSKDDITINGSGSLMVSSPAAHGVVCKDDLAITGGTITVESASHGFDANDSIRMTGATISITAGKDALHVENADDTTKGFLYSADGTYELNAQGDGMSASSYVSIKDGTYTITAGGGSENGEAHDSGAYGDFMGNGPGGMGGMGKAPGGQNQQTPPDQGSRSNGSQAPAPGGNSVQNQNQQNAQTRGMSFLSSEQGGSNLMHQAANNSAPLSSEANADATSSSDTTESTSMKGIKAGTDLTIAGGTFTINTADDAFHSNATMKVDAGTFDVKTGDDGFHADDSLEVCGGNITVSESYEGLEAEKLTISGGDITIVADDDGLNAAGGKDQSGLGGRDTRFGVEGMGGGPDMNSSQGSLLISGGTLSITASGDALDANGTLEITGGHITTQGPTRGDTSILDFDKSGVINGGTFIGTGSSGMPQVFSSSDQGVISAQITMANAQDKLELKDSNGTVILSTTPTLSYNMVILSSPDIHKGDAYTLTVGSNSQVYTAS